MELDDMFYVGKRPVTLRLVLGLMEEADNSLETYRWATPALMHSIHTKDTTISDYVKEVFVQKGLTPYKPYKEEEKTEKLSAEEQLKKVKMDEFMMLLRPQMIGVSVLFYPYLLGLFAVHQFRFPLKKWTIERR